MAVITKGALRKMVQEEIRKQKLQKEENVAANAGAYNTPKFVKKKI